MDDQDRPLAPTTSRYSAEENGDFSAEQSRRDARRRRGLICCSCCALTTVMIGLIILILAFTVFKIKNPEVTFNSVKIEGLDTAVRQGSNPQPGLNVTFISDLSIKNPNFASFKFTNATTWMYYGDVDIGEVRSPPGNARAHKTLHMNVTVDVMVDTVTQVSRFPSDVRSGQMTIETYTYIRGRVHLLLIKKHVDVELNCTMIIVLSTQTIEDEACKRTVHM